MKKIFYSFIFLIALVIITGCTIKGNSNNKLVCTSGKSVDTFYFDSNNKFLNGKTVIESDDEKSAKEMYDRLIYNKKTYKTQVYDKITLKGKKIEVTFGPKNYYVSQRQSELKNMTKEDFKEYYESHSFVCE